MTFSWKNRDVGTEYMKTKKKKQNKQTKKNKQNSRFDY